MLLTHNKTVGRGWEGESEGKGSELPSDRYPLLGPESLLSSVSLASVFAHLPKAILWSTAKAFSFSPPAAISFPETSRYPSPGYPSHCPHLPRLHFRFASSEKPSVPHVRIKPGDVEFILIAIYIWKCDAYCRWSFMKSCNYNVQSRAEFKVIWARFVDLID